MQSNKLSAVRYEVRVFELAMNGEHGVPQVYVFTGPGARERALGWAELEFADRGGPEGSITSVRVRRLGGKAPESGVSLLCLRSRRDMMRDLVAFADGAF